MFFFNVQPEIMELYIYDYFCKELTVLEDICDVTEAVDTFHCTLYEII